MMIRERNKGIPFLLAVAFCSMVIGGCTNEETKEAAYDESKFEVLTFQDLKLHSYDTGNALGDINYIIQGKDALVMIEPVSFYEDIEEMNAYVKALEKPVEKVIADYHTAGFGNYELSKIIMVEDMPEFEKGPAYSGMLKHFADVFHGAMAIEEHGETEVVLKNSSETWAGIEFQFYPGVATDFPGASINIGGEVYYTHFTPVKAHLSPMLINGAEAINAVSAELERAKAEGVKVIIGGHAAATADLDTVDFELTYLKKMGDLHKAESTADGFIAAMRAAYPDLPFLENLGGVAKALYR